MREWQRDVLMKDHSDQLVLREDSDGIATLTLNAPGSINALSEAMLKAMSATLDEVAAILERL